MLEFLDSSPGAERLEGTVLIALRPSDAADSLADRTERLQARDRPQHPEPPGEFLTPTGAALDPRAKLRRFRIRPGRASGSVHMPTRLSPSVSQENCADYSDKTDDL
jgi:hypothetical protein